MTIENLGTRSNPFRIDVETEDGRHVISPHGELDLSTAPQLDQRLNESLAEGETVLDLAGVRFIDSSGIALLVYISQTAREHGQRLELRNPSPQVEKLIKLAGVEPLLAAPESQRVTIDHHTQAPNTDS